MRALAGFRQRELWIIIHVTETTTIGCIVPQQNPASHGRICGGSSQALEVCILLFPVECCTTARIADNHDRSPAGFFAAAVCGVAEAMALLLRLAMPHWHLRGAVFVCFAVHSVPAFATDIFPGTTIAGTGSLTGTNTGAASEPGEPVTFGGGAVESIWYSWTAPATGVAVFATCNQTGNIFGNFDTTMGIYTGAAVNALTVVGTNDDTTTCNVTTGALGSVVQFNAVSGAVYRIQVDGYASLDGNYNLHFGMVGITVAVTDNIAVEAGAGGAFTVRLNTPPRSNATVTVGASPQCSFAPATRTFTNSNWATPQTFTVTAVNDALIEGIHSCSPATLNGSGGGYAGVSATPPTIIVYDDDIASFSIAKAVNAASIAAPATLSYAITIVNTSGVNMTVPVLTDVLTQGGPALTLTSGPTGPTGDAGTLGRLDVGETWIYTATYAVPQSGIDNGTTLTNAATFDTAQTAPSAAVATTTITSSPLIGVTKLVDDDTNVIVGQSLTYIYVVTNTGNKTLTNISLSDLHGGSGPAPTPVGEVLSSDVAPTGTSTDATPNNGIWSILAPGDSVTFTGTYQVTQNDVDILQ